MTQPNLPDPERAEQIAQIRKLADWLETNRWVPTPYFVSAYEHLSTGDGSEMERLVKVREVAAEASVQTDESLDDRTKMTVKFGPRVSYELVAWHKAGRPDPEREDELERLRARVAELEAVRVGLDFSRDMPDDPTPVSPARMPMHTGAVVDGGALVDETPVEAR